MNGHLVAGPGRLPQQVSLIWNVISTFSTITVLYLLMTGQPSKAPVSAGQPNSSHDQEKAAEARQPAALASAALGYEGQPALQRSTGWYTHPKDGDLGRLGKEVRQKTEFLP
jgi:hypothetical protein